MISVRNLSHYYAGRRRQPMRQALDSLDLNIGKGVFFVITGPNGGGKSTLFKILAGLLEPTSGRVEIDGVNLLKNPRQARYRMGVVFQNPALDSHLTLLENLRLHARLYGMNRDQFERKLTETLHWTDLADRLEERVGTLSGGLFRQLELVKALLHAPSLLLMDEPTTGLDPGSRMAFLKTLLRIQKERQVTIVMTSHSFFEAERADRVAILKSGRWIAEETPARLTSSLGHEILIIETKTPDLLREALSDQNCRVQFSTSEIRVEGVDLMPLLEKLHHMHRDRIDSISLKKPTLEDVYVHVTGHAPRDDEEREKQEVKR